MWENTDQKNSEYEQILRSDYCVVMLKLAMGLNLMIVINPPIVIKNLKGSVFITIPKYLEQLKCCWQNEITKLELPCA